MVYHEPLTEKLEVGVVGGTGCLAGSCIWYHSVQPPLYESCSLLPESYWVGWLGLLGGCLCEGLGEKCFRALGEKILLGEILPYSAAGKGEQGQAMGKDLDASARIRP